MELAIKTAEVTLLQEVDKSEIDKEVDRIISQHKNNRYEINRLVFESVAALTESENYSFELNTQGTFKRFWGGITGKNRRLHNGIDNSLARAQYASQQTLQKLAEQNLMSFELITAVNNKLNASIIEVETEINKIYGTLVTFFKQTKSDIIQLENRVDRLEKNVNLLNWQNSIEYQMWNGIEYADLEKNQKIVCIVRDFFDLTKGKWTTSDLLLLKTAMATINLQPKEDVNYKEFILSIQGNQELLGKLFEGLTLKGVENYSQYVTIASGIQKKTLLDTSEQYTIDSVIKLLADNGCRLSEDVVKDNILNEYEKKYAKVNINTSINAYDFVVELLYNLEYVKEIMYVQTLDDKMKKAELLFSYNEIEKVFPMLQELSDYGYIKAKYMLALIYGMGYTGIDKNVDKAFQLFYECLSENYYPAFYDIMDIMEKGEVEEEKELVIAINEWIDIFDIDISKKSISSSEDELFDAIEMIMMKCLEICKQMANQGDIFAALVYSRIFFEVAEEKEEYISAISWASQGPFAIGNYLAALIYEWDWEGKDLKKSFELHMKAANFGLAAAEHSVGKAYQLGIGTEKNDELSYVYYKRAYEHGSRAVCLDLGNCYIDGRGTNKDDLKAFEIFVEGDKCGVVGCTDNIGWCYQNGRGINKNMEKAKEFYLKAASMGSTYSQKMLDKYF